MRLQKYLADCGVASRRKAEEIIEAGRVKVNGKTVSALGSTIAPGADRVELDGKLLTADAKGVILFHKPRLVVSTRLDPQNRPTVMDYLPARYKSYFPVGRLDFESAGLMILTNDGDLADVLMHPRHRVERRYKVKVAKAPDKAVLQKISAGLELEDGIVKARIRIAQRNKSAAWLDVTLWEGRNRLIRRIMEEVGHPVLALRRISHGPFRLGNLKAGEYIKLSAKEYQDVRKAMVGGRG